MHLFGRITSSHLDTQICTYLGWCVGTYLCRYICVFLQKAKEEEKVLHPEGKEGAYPHNDSIADALVQNLYAIARCHHVRLVS